MPHPASAALAALLAPALPQAEKKPLTLEAIYGTEADEQVDFSGDPLRGLEWLDGSRWLEIDEQEDEADPAARPTQRLLVVDARSGRTEPFYDPAALAELLGELPGVNAEDAERLARPRSLSWNEDRSAALVEHASDLFFVQPAEGVARRLTLDPAEEVGAELSPDGRFASFVRHHDLHLVEVDSARERALTDDGSEELLYGRLDWVYQEEVYGRGNFKGYWWSPDSERLVFLRIDESPVHEFTVVDHLPTRLETEVTNYPKAGDPNPTVRLGVVRAVGGPITWIDTAEYEPIEHLIVRVGWTPDARRVVFQVQDREQTWLDLNLADPRTGEVRRLLRETSPAWVSVLGTPHWLADGGFLWLSERSGHAHLYRYDADGALQGAVTEGAWDVRDVHGVDEEGGAVWITSSEAGPLEQHLWRVSLEDGERKRLTTRPGWHDAEPSPDFSMFLDTWSDVHTPTRVFLHGADGALLRTVDENPVPALGEVELGEVQFFRLPARDGFEMEAVRILPPDFEPTRRHPVLIYQYSGPQAPVVRNSWGGKRYLWHQMLAQQGYVVFSCDNRSASNKGVAPAWEAYGQLGVVELRDLTDQVEWLRQQPWVDPARIGIWGWSYGGFMTAYAMTHSELFRAGIAGAPVTDWHLYDTIYTERYMRRPQNNAEGYAATSVVKAAGDLSGRLLLVHGTMDDNVHLQNTLKLAHELQQAGKDFELMLYPRSRHGLRDPKLVLHLQRTMTDFLLENL